MCPLCGLITVFVREGGIIMSGWGGEFCTSSLWSVCVPPCVVYFHQQVSWSVFYIYICIWRNIYIWIYFVRFRSICSRIWMDILYLSHKELFLKRIVQTQNMTACLYPLPPTPNIHNYSDADDIHFVVPPTLERWTFNYNSCKSYKRRVYELLIKSPSPPLQSATTGGREGVRSEKRKILCL